MSRHTPKSGEYPRWAQDWMAERVGFEPTIQFPVYGTSNAAPSAARPPLHRTCGAATSIKGGRYSIPTVRIAYHRRRQKSLQTSGQALYGGEGGIRTHGPVTRTAVFETARFGRSRTSPPNRSRNLFLLPQPFKEFLQQRPALLFQHAPDHLDAVVQAPFLRNVED